MFVQRQILNSLLVPATHQSQLTTPKTMMVPNKFKIVEKKLESDILSSAFGNLSPKLESRDIKTPDDLPFEKHLNDTVDLRENFKTTKRLMKNQKHMLTFEQTKISDFSKGGLKMRNFKEESDRMLAPQFNKENIKRMEKLARQKALKQELRLANFFNQGVNN